MGAEHLNPVMPLQGKNDSFHSVVTNLWPLRGIDDHVNSVLPLQGKNVFLNLLLPTCSPYGALKII
jgi:hypothetical protein